MLSVNSQELPTKKEVFGDQMVRRKSIKRLATFADSIKKSLSIQFGGASDAKCRCAKGHGGER